MEWKPEYALGIRNIDHQHAHILEFITQFESLSDDKALLDEATTLILRTREFMEFHFSVEESLMRLLPYPGWEAHRAEHSLELKHIADIERAMRNGSIRGSLAVRMRDCLFGHIIAGDKRFAQFALNHFGHGARDTDTDHPDGMAMRLGERWIGSIDADMRHE